MLDALFDQLAPGDPIAAAKQVVFGQPAPQGQLGDAGDFRGPPDGWLRHQRRQRRFLPARQLVGGCFGSVHSWKASEAERLIQR